ncbi:MAG: phenylphosphate carboxylase subunit gamma [Desulfobacterales bacterium]|nr:phenylphosphate carboxylase subunit gamma [Desulfobacterales bacterium]
MKKQYDTFIQNVNDLSNGQQYDLTIRDLTPGTHKYESRFVRAVVYNTPDQSEDTHVLRLRFLMGLLHPKPRGIKILEELGEYEAL